MVTVNLYEYSELSEEAKNIALGQIRNLYDEDEHNEYLYSIMDLITDDSCFEPPHKYMASILGEDYVEKNNDRFMFVKIDSAERNFWIDENFDRSNIDDMLTVTNESYLFKILGLTQFESVLDFEISKERDRPVIEFNILFNDTKIPADLLIQAEKIFDSLVTMILEAFKTHYEYQWTRDAIEDRLSEDDKFENFLFDEVGMKSPILKNKI